jgi:hypothetical protein
MKHTYAKEINAWLNGEDVECKDLNGGDWYIVDTISCFGDEDSIFRIKPIPPEPQYLYVYERKTTGFIALSKIKRNDKHYDLICRVKVENDDLPTTI